MEIAIVRAAHLYNCIEELREIGVPVERELARSRLPPWILENPDAYVSYALCLDWHKPPHLNWSTVMFRKRRTENGEQATQARGNSPEVAAG